MAVAHPHRTGPAARARTVALGVVLAALSLVATSCLLATPEGPPGLRYRDEVFATVQKTADVTYGSALNRQGAQQSLELDLYQPAGDTVERRPLVVWIHGGSFRSGTKTSAEIVDEANTFARKGYVTASIEYRLSSTGCAAAGANAECLEAIADAIEDAQAAVRFLRANADSYRIDPARIAVAGTSAGAITALNVGYGTPVPGNSGTPGESSTVAAAVSLSGAQIFTAQIGAGDPPALLFHGTADTVVPYAWATATVDVAKAAGLPVELVSWEGAGHVPYSANRSQIIDLTTNFLYHTLTLRLLG
jgi:acetyl esterase/lipase